MHPLWTIAQASFLPEKQHHRETVFTIGNGYLSTRGAFEEAFPGERRATFIHGVFDDVPIAFTELANAPDWLPLGVYLNGERFSLAQGRIESFERRLDLQTGRLERTVQWRSPSGWGVSLIFERFTSLAEPHTLFIRCRAVPDFRGRLEFRAALDGNSHNLGVVHWEWLDQGGASDGVSFLKTRTRATHIAVGMAMRLGMTFGRESGRWLWDVENRPTLVVECDAAPGEEVCVEKSVAVFTSRDGDGDPARAAVECLESTPGYDLAFGANAEAWSQEWSRTDVEIDGDDEAQLALRYNLFQTLIAAPRRDDRVNIGAKTLSGFGYRGHAFWDTETFILPVFTYTAPEIARNLLDYRYRLLPAARRNAQAGGHEGARFPWESAASGEEVTPTWLPHPADRTRLVRIWTGDIEIHISADIAYAAHQYWRATGDDEWFAAAGAELILDTAKFWASRAEWNAAAGRYEYNDVIGPDEFHEHVDNNAFTNRMAQWNLETALEVLAWLRANATARAAELAEALDLSEARLSRWRDVIARIYLPIGPHGLIEQFQGYFRRREVDLAALEPRTRSVQEIFGIEGANELQAIKQPDVLMLLYLLSEHYPDETVHVNFDYYTPRTDHTYGSSLGPSIQAIMATRVGRPDEAYGHFMRAAQADLLDVRGNAGDGIHAASAGGLWQAAVFGFGGLKVTPESWRVEPRLPSHWKRLKFKFFHRGVQQEVVCVQP